MVVALYGFMMHVVCMYVCDGCLYRICLMKVTQGDIESWKKMKEDERGYTDA